MKNIIYILLLLMSNLLITPKSYAQLEVIDKIAEVLIPGITNGIKSVLDSSGNKKVKKEEVEKLESDLTEKMKELIIDIEKDASNISALNEIFAISGVLYDDIGGMLTITKPEFINEIDSTKSHHLFRETAIQFTSEWRQVDKKKNDLIKLTENASSGSVQDDLAQYIQNLDEALTDLESVLRLSKEPDLNMDMKSASNYIKKLSRSDAREQIKEIENAVEDIHVQLSTRIKSLKKSLEDTKTELERETSNENN